MKSTCALHQHNEICISTLQHTILSVLIDDWLCMSNFQSCHSSSIRSVYYPMPLQAYLYNTTDMHCCPFCSLPVSCMQLHTSIKQCTFERSFHLSHPLHFSHSAVIMPIITSSTVKVPISTTINSKQTVPLQYLQMIKS
jgi:hypothetical protein